MTTKKAVPAKMTPTLSELLETTPEPVVEEVEEVEEEISTEVAEEAMDEHLKSYLEPAKFSEDPVYADVSEDDDTGRSVK